MSLYHPIFPAQLSQHNVETIHSLVYQSALIVNKVLSYEDLLRKTKPLILPHIMADLKAILLLSQENPNILISFYLLKVELSYSSLMEILNQDQPQKDYDLSFAVLTALHQVKSVYDQIEHVHLVKDFSR
jgi:hypothetical protein